MLISDGASRDGMTDERCLNAGVRHASRNRVTDERS